MNNNHKDLGAQLALSPYLLDLDVSENRTVVIPTTDYLLMESGDFLLLESGDKIIL